MPNTTLSRSFLVLCLGVVCSFGAVSTSPVTLETSQLRFHIYADTGAYEILDKAAKTVWRSHPLQARFGEVVVNQDGVQKRYALDQCETKVTGDSMDLTFHPIQSNSDAWLRVALRIQKGSPVINFTYTSAPTLAVDKIWLLDNALWATDLEQGALLVPVREGLMIPADSGKAFGHTFNTFAYEGCHMEMFGVLKNGACAMVTWHDPYVSLDVKSVLTNNLPRAGESWPRSSSEVNSAGASNVLGAARQILLPSLILSRTAHSAQVHFLGKGDAATLCAAYRQVAQAKGWFVPWSEKLKGSPERAKLFGASNVKLWGALSREMNDASTQEVRAKVNYTFDEAAQVAEHLKKDLKMDKVLFTVGGWIHRGYDNQHPDILPAAPECGGDAALADCSRRVMDLGYLFCLHDNYQDIYRDSPSWNEDVIMKTRDGKLQVGGKWAGGRAYLTCSQKAVDLAKRPQNLPAVSKLTRANSYFIDTTYAAGLCECYDTNHPLTRADDMKWKQELSDYSRSVFGVFGSECGREWAIPHADFFEGLSGVSGGHYHDAGLEAKLGATVVPLFEMVFHDCIAIYGKYGYDNSKAAGYVLDHLLYARPLNYHSLPAHLYWKSAAPEISKVLFNPTVAEFQATGPRQFRIAYDWQVEQPIPQDWRILVHFTDASDAIKFQNDHAPDLPTSQWKPGKIHQGPFTVNVPEGLKGSFDVKIGFFQTVAGERAPLAGKTDPGRRRTLGQVTVSDTAVSFTPAKEESPASLIDPSVFVQAHGGWADGMHPMDRFMKNTHEILSPLNEITAQMPMTGHRFLTPDRKVQQTLFGKGVVTVTVNASAHDFPMISKTSGHVTLPPYGFLVESPTFIAFHASTWQGIQYSTPALFTFSSQDGRSLDNSRKIRVYHGFGDPRFKWGNKTARVERESIL